MFATQLALFPEITPEITTVNKGSAAEVLTIHARIDVPGRFDEPCQVTCRCGFQAAATDLWEGQGLAWRHDLTAHWRSDARS